MSFLRLEKEAYPAAKDCYLSEKRFYPIISSVLDQQQEGSVFADDRNNPRCFFVEHKFGFSQLFGAKDRIFFRSLKKYLFVDKAFVPPKIRAYAPTHADFFLGLADISERCQFRLADNSRLVSAPSRGGAQVRDISEKTLTEVDEVFGLDLCMRFWGSRDDFLSHSLAKVLTFKGNHASICYAAAVSDGIAEIDVATLPKYRQQGFGRIVCSGFIRRCQARGIIPNWDCFTNNAGSMRLAESLGFVKHGEPYTFFTVKKTDN